MFFEGSTSQPFWREKNTHICVPVLCGQGMQKGILQNEIIIIIYFNFKKLKSLVLDISKKSGFWLC